MFPPLLTKGRCHSPAHSVAIMKRTPGSLQRCRCSRQVVLFFFFFSPFKYNRLQMTNEGNNRYSGEELNGPAASAAAALHDKRREGLLMWPASTLDVFSGVFMARDNSHLTQLFEKTTLTGKRWVFGNNLEISPCSLTPTTSWLLCAPIKASKHEIISMFHNLKSSQFCKMTHIL